MKTFDTQNNPEKILLVDDEEGLLTLLKIMLNKERYFNITCADTGQDALKKIQHNQYDLIILDVMLPDYSGFDLCAQIRLNTHTPIIFLSACASDFDKLSGLTIGGDDYVTKPFNSMELIARIKAVFRRQKLERDFLQQENTIQKPFDYGYFTLDPLQASLTVKGLNIECTAKELELLAFFCRNPNRIYTVTQLYDAVWGTLQDGLEKTVVIHISKLRKKLLDEEKPSRIIVNMRGIGYKFIPPDHG